MNTSNAVPTMNGAIQHTSTSLHGQPQSPNHDILNPGYFHTYTDAISNKGGALQNCFGFIDRMIRPICRPSQEQRIMFKGHKRVHSLKPQ